VRRFEAEINLKETGDVRIDAGLKDEPRSPLRRNCRSGPQAEGNNQLCLALPFNTHPLDTKRAAVSMNASESAKS
jgi:hypothetical protein